jgi:signal transduction histidine kinase
MTPSANEVDVAALQASLQEKDRQIEYLTAELAETNTGVMALYAELEDGADQLRRVSELKSKFLSYLSHEFRTPLGSIRSISRILLDGLDGPLTSEQEQQVRLVQGSAAELSDMVDDLLDLAKIEAGRITISPEWFHMVDIMAALRGMFRPIVENTSVNLIFEEPDDISPIFTDHRKLSQILRNLISNAIKFTKKGDVRVGACRNGEDEVMFTVSDTGIGIAPEHLSEIFKEFTQIDSQLQRQVIGTGLGLSLCLRFAELLRGNITAESQPGVGSVFRLTIPCRLTTDADKQEGGGAANG